MVCRFVLRCQPCLLRLSEANRALSIPCILIVQIALRPNAKPSQGSFSCNFFTILTACIQTPACKINFDGVLYCCLAGKRLQLDGPLRCESRGHRQGSLLECMVFLSECMTPPLQDVNQSLLCSTRVCACTSPAFDVDAAAACCSTSPDGFQLSGILLPTPCPPAVATSIAPWRFFAGR